MVQLTKPIHVTLISDMGSISSRIQLPGRSQKPLTGSFALIKRTQVLGLSFPVSCVHYQEAESKAK